METVNHKSGCSIRPTRETGAELSKSREVSDLINGATILGIVISWIMLISSLTDSAQSALTRMSDATELALGATPGHSLNSINLVYWCNICCITTYVITGTLVVPIGFFARYLRR